MPDTTAPPPYGRPSAGHGGAYVPQEAPGLGARRARSFGWFLLAVLYALFAERIAPIVAGVFFTGVFAPLAVSVVLLVLLLAGFAAMGMIGQLQRNPLRQMGLVRRPGMRREWGIGAALGWAGVVACVLPLAVLGGLAVTINDQGFFYGVAAFVSDTLALLVASLATEVVFRGYPFQRLMETTGVTLATLLMSLLFAVDRLGAAPLTLTDLTSTFLLGLLLAVAYLRTRALWTGWGFHFAWSASMAVLFGLPITGQTQFSPVLSSYISGPRWLSGNGLGPEDSLLAVVVLAVLFFVMLRATRELRHRWGHPEIVGAGVPVDIDGLSRAQHAAGMGPVTAEPAAASLVQIAPAQPGSHVESRVDPPTAPLIEPPPQG